MTVRVGPRRVGFSYTNSQTQAAYCMSNPRQIELGMVGRAYHAESGDFPIVTAVYPLTVRRWRYGRGVVHGDDGPALAQRNLRSPMVLHNALIVPVGVLGTGGNRPVGVQLTMAVRATVSAESGINQTASRYPMEQRRCFTNPVK